MVLESLINPFKAEKKPWVLLFLGFSYGLVGLFLALWIFAEHASLIMIFLTVLAALPLIYNTIKMEEKKDETIQREKILLKEHAKALTLYLCFFLGAVAAFTFCYLILPSSLSNVVFSAQTKTIASLNQQITGNAVATSIFGKIVMNNLKVLIFCILFSFIYGAGALFILVWNASVIAAALGNFIRAHLSQYAFSLGFDAVAKYLSIFSLSLARYMIHGIPEIFSYIIAGFAGGIISVAVIRHKIGTKNFFHVIADAADLLFISVALLIVSAAIEVWVTPMFF